jgi:hypothetical protein
VGVSPFCVSLVESCDIPETGEESHIVLIGYESIWRLTVLVCVNLVHWSDEKCGSGPAEYISEQLSDVDQLISRRSNFQSFDLHYHPL